METKQGFKTFYGKVDIKKIVEKAISIFLLILCCVMLVFLTFNLFFFRASIVGISMQPTLNNYKTGEIWTEEDYDLYQDVGLISRFASWGNGDIILIQTQGMEAIVNGYKYKMEEQVIVKRVIATEGQTLTLRYNTKGENGGHCEYLVNGQAIDESYLTDKKFEMDRKYFEDFCDACKSEQNFEYDRQQNTATITIAKGKVFVLGDNRGRSQDSHLFGSFDTSSVLGKMIYSYSYNESFLGAIFNDFF